MKSKEVTSKKIVEMLKSFGADKAQVEVTKKMTTELSSEHGELSLLRTTNNQSVEMMAIKDERKGSLTLNTLDEDKVKLGAKETIELCDSAVVDSSWGISTETENQSWTHGELEPNKDYMVERMAEFLNQVKSAYPTILFESLILSHTKSIRQFANSNGLELESTKGSYSCLLMFSPKEGKNVSSFNYTDLMLKDLSTPLLESSRVKRYLDEAVKQLDKTSLGHSFKGKILLTPAAVEDLFRHIKGHISSMSLLQDVSLFSDHLGKKIVSDLLTFKAYGVSDAVEAKNFFTSDGFKTVEGAVIEEGVLKNYLLNQYSSHKLQKPHFTNNCGCVEMLPGDMNLEEMIQSVDRGVALTRFSGGNPNAKGDLSGVVKNSFIIEEGKMGKALEETMMSVNVIDLFNNVMAVSKETEDVGYSKYPWILAEGVTFS